MFIPRNRCHWEWNLFPITNSNRLMMVNGKAIKFDLLSLKSSQRINARSLMAQPVPLSHLQGYRPFPNLISPLRVRARACPSVSGNTDQRTSGTLSLHSWILQHLPPGFSKCTILATPKTCECPEGRRRKPLRAQENSGGDRPGVRRSPAEAHRLSSQGCSVSFPPGSVFSLMAKS